MRNVMLAVKRSLCEVAFHPHFEKESEAAAYIMIMLIIGTALMVGVMAVVGVLNAGEIY